MYLSSNIQFLREQQKLSFARLAELCAVDALTMQELENDAANVTLPLLLSLSAHFNFSIDTLVKIDLKTKHEKASSNIKFLVIDIDGVLTDGGMYYTERGDEFKKFNAKDGIAIKRLVEGGMEVAFLSNGKNAELVKNRAALLGVQRVHVDFGQKLTVLDAWVNELNIDYANVAYIGDDVNDLKVIEKVGFSACPDDATEIVKQKVNVVLSRKGGDACVRELIDGYFETQPKK